MNDDVFDFFYEALPGYEEVGRRRDPARLLGRVQQPRPRRLRLQEHGRLGQRDVRHPGRGGRRRAGHDRTSSTSTSASASCSARPTTRTGTGEETFVPKDPLGNPVDQRHPWNQTTIPKPQKRDLEGGNYSWVMSPRWYDKRTGDNLALDTGGGALARLWATALAEQGRHAVREGDRLERADHPAEDAGHARADDRVEDPAVVERDRARPRADLLRRLRGGHGAALPRPRVRGDPRRPDEGVRGLRRPRRGDRLRLPRGRARRALAPPGDPRRQDRQLPPVPADAVERQPDRLLRHAGPVRGRR